MDVSRLADANLRYFQKQRASLSALRTGRGGGWPARRAVAGESGANPIEFSRNIKILWNSHNKQIVRSLDPYQAGIGSRWFSRTVNPQPHVSAKINLTRRAWR